MILEKVIIKKKRKRNENANDDNDDDGDTSNDDDDLEELSRWKKRSIFFDLPIGRLVFMSKIFFVILIN